MTKEQKEAWLNRLAYRIGFEASKLQMQKEELEFMKTIWVGELSRADQRKWNIRKKQLEDKAK